MSASAGHKTDDKLLPLIRSLTRYTLAQLRLERTHDASGSEFDLHAPEPLSPCAIDAIHRALSKGELMGDELVDVATFVGVRHEVCSQTNDFLGECAKALMARDTEAVRLALAQLRGMWMSVPALGILFAGVLDASGRDRPHARAAAERFALLLDDAHWLRLIATLAVASAIIGSIDRLGATRHGAIDPALQRLVTLLCLTGYTNLRSSGVPTPRSLVALWVEQCEPTERRGHWLPLSCAPESVREALKTQSASRRMLADNSNSDRALWLLRAALRARLPDFLLSAAQVEALAGKQSTEYGFVGALRRTLFALPCAGIDFERASRSALWRATPSSEPHAPETCQHMFDALRRFRTAARAAGLSDDDGRAICNALAFDCDWADNECTPVVALARRTSDARLRIVERAFTCGFASVHRGAFGVLAIEADRREPITALDTRVPRPATPGATWRSVRPPTHERDYICGKRLGELSESERVNDRRAALARAKRAKSARGEPKRTRDAQAVRAQEPMV